MMLGLLLLMVSSILSALAQEGPRTRENCDSMIKPKRRERT